MNSRMRSLSSTAALVGAVRVLALWPRAVDRPSPRLAVASIPATRPAPRPRPPTARENAQASRSNSLRQIQPRWAEFSERSAALREQRRRHSEEELQVLDGWQRRRLARAPGNVARRDR